jgi:hypothetical protein
MSAANNQSNLSTINASEFAMWRAVFAFAYVDNSLSLEEQKILHAYLTKAPFSLAQRVILKDDLRHPKDVSVFYKQITRPEDKTRFCVLARAIAWCEGEVSAQEKYILKKMSCFGEVVDEEILHNTREHPHIETYYNQYAKSGMMGLFRTPHLLEIRV